MRVCALLIIALCCGCAGARPTLIFDDARYPISMSQFLLDADGRVVEPEELQPLGIFEYERTGYAIGYTLIPLNKLDLSQITNETVERLGGEAIIQLEVTAKTTPCWMTNTLVFGLNMMPFYPGCSGVYVQGLVVKRKNREKNP